MNSYTVDTPLGIFLFTVAIVAFLTLKVLTGWRRRSIVGGAAHVVARFQGKRAQKRLWLAGERIRDWANQNGLQYRNLGNQLRRDERMAANTTKKFFGANIVMDFTDDGPFVYGTLQGRSVWLYAIVGRPQLGSMHGDVREEKVEEWFSRPSLLSSSSDSKVEHVLYAWCLEVATNPIAHTLRITRKSLRESDTLDTESRTFEQRYNTEVIDSLALQLLDPHMMQLIVDSRADALEFSERSVVLYEVGVELTSDILDMLFASAVNIAQQADRNYPLAKYVHNAH